MTEIPKLQLEVGDFIEGELDYDYDDLLRRIEFHIIHYKKVRN
jgi:hypothetical protein